MSCTDPLPLDVLRGLRIVVTHKDCPDGVASALIVRAALPHVAVIAVSPESKQHRALVAEPGMLFVDIAPPRDRIDEFVAAGVAILDHHPTARAATLAAGSLGRYADAETDPGISGALLAYHCVYQPLHPPPATVITRAMHDLATLAGIRDTWQTKHSRWTEASEQAAALAFWPLDTLLGALLVENIAVESLASCLRFGPMLWEQRQARAAAAIAEGYSFDTSGLRVLVVNQDHPGDVAEMAPEFDLVVGFHYFAEGNVPRMKLSLRSHAPFQCKPLAEAYGGGGHEHAAGFTRHVLLGQSPYEVIRKIVCDYTDGDGYRMLRGAPFAPPEAVVEPSPAPSAQDAAAFIAKWSPTHDLDACPIHGSWKLGPKMGGLFVATCPGCCADAVKDGGS